MLAYAVGAARNSGLFSKVIVSTDDPAIGRVAEWYGAEVVVRPGELATDQAGLVDVALHALQTLHAQGVEVDTLCQLMPNCPLRRSADITDHYRRFATGDRHFQISVVPYQAVYPHWALSSDNDSRGAWLFGTQHLVPSQQLSQAFCPTGAIWWVQVNTFVEQKAFYGAPFHLAPMDAIRGIDIDHLEELELADILVRGLQARDGASPLEPIAVKPYHA